MSARTILLAIGAAGLAAMLLFAALDLPPVGHYAGVYGATLVQVAVPERHATDVVSAVNFDYRAFDTLGEEFILFSSVLGVAVLLRKQSDEEDEEGDDEDDAVRPAAPTSETVRVLAVGLVGFVVAFGAYVCAHGQISPGGGFQGGVVLATAPLVVYLAAEAKTFLRIAPEGLVKAAEAIGAAGFAVVGAIAFLSAAPFLANVLPLGEPGDVLSAGTLVPIDLAVGLEVAAGFVSLLHVFLEDALKRRTKGARS